MKRHIRRIPIVGDAARAIYYLFTGAYDWSLRFRGSENYWNTRYARGAHSGAGSYGKLADFKAEIVNDIVRRNRVASVIEFGCGDGNQLRLAEYPEYIGIDISPHAVAMCRRKFAGDPTKSFMTLREYRGERAELAISLDVIYHLIEDSTFDAYMRTLFAAAERLVVIYSSNVDDDSGRDGPHIRHRRFVGWVAEHAPRWRMIGHVPNRYAYTGDPETGSFAEFFVFAADRP